ELGEAQRQMATRLESADLPAAARAYITSAYERLQATANQWAQLKSAQMEVSREMVAELRNEVRKAIASLKLREVADQRAGSVG
ncbi:MAG TPA: hypothetical protein VGO90_02180, partial [Chthoniobacteraceae bacterium]|nr:hypothetical protein [Chthoniobacteraceae bacterium]